MEPLCSNAAPRSSAPWPPIRLPERLRLVRVPFVSLLIFQKIRKIYFALENLIYLIFFIFIFQIFVIFQIDENWTVLAAGNCLGSAF